MTKTQETGSRAYLFSIVLVAIIGGLLFGYDTAVVSGAEQALDQFFRSAAGFTYTPWMHGFTASSALVGCVIGGALSGLLASRLGRKRSLVAAAVLFFVSAVGSWRPESGILPYGEASLPLLASFNIYRILGGVSAWDLPRPCVRCTLPKSRPRRSAARSSRATSSPSSSACWSSTS